MAEAVPTYPESPLSAAWGRGTIYTVLGIVTLVALLVVLGLGIGGWVGPGLFQEETALAVGGLAIIVLAVSTLILLFSLTGTIRLINQQMADLTRLRQAIEKSYARLHDATETLADEVGDLKQALPQLKKVAGRLAPKTSA